MLPLTELGHSRQGQPNVGGVKWESSPHVGMESQRSTTPMQNAPTFERYLHRLWRDDFIPFKAAKQNDSQSEKTEHEVVLP